MPALGVALVWGLRPLRIFGRRLASIVVGAAILAGFAEVLAFAIAHGCFDADVLDANAPLALAPPTALAVSMLGVRMVHPLGALASVRAVLDLGAFAVASALVVFLFSKFIGWGVLFLGSGTELIVIAVLGWFMLRRMYRRAFGIPQLGADA